MARKRPNSTQLNRSMGKQLAAEFELMRARCWLAREVCCSGKKQHNSAESSTCSSMTAARVRDNYARDMQTEKEKRGRAESAGLLTNVLDTDEPGEGRRRWRGSRARARGRDDVLAPNPWLRLRVMQGRRARCGGSTPALR
jgi:hypothetical protein